MVKEWGKITWFLLHGIAEKCRSDNYHIYKNELFTVIINIIYNLPCPDCRQHAINFFKKKNANMYPTKESLIDLIFKFHNLVNERIHKPIYSKQDLIKYKRLDFMKTVQLFEHIYTRNSYNRLLGDQMSRRFMMNNIKKVLLDKNIFQ